MTTIKNISLEEIVSVLGDDYTEGHFIDVSKESSALVLRVFVRAEESPDPSEGPVRNPIHTKIKELRFNKKRIGNQMSKKSRHAFLEEFKHNSYFKFLPQKFFAYIFDVSMSVVSNDFKELSLPKPDKSASFISDVLYQMRVKES